MEPPPKHDIPPEIIEKILLNLPAKSLSRFSCVSKSWKSMISEPWFVANYRRRATKRVVINDNPLYFHVQSAFSCPLSSITSHHHTDGATSISCPFRADVKLRAFCDELWCVTVKKSMYIWNPSMGTYRKLPDPPPLRSYCGYAAADPYVQAVYGMCYDAAADDYKLLKVWRIFSYRQGTLLYSLRHDSWRKIHHNFPGKSFPESNGEFVNGAFHWMVITRLYYPQPQFVSTLISFDLSTERYKEMPQPVYSPALNSGDRVEITVLKGMLCVFLNYRIRRSYRDAAFVLWAMKDYGVAESWTIMYEIRYKIIPLMVPNVRITEKLDITLTPLYVYENGEVLIWVRGGYRDWNIVVYKHKQVAARREIDAPGTKVVPVAGGRSLLAAGIRDVAGGRRMVRAGFVFVESLVSPAAWPPLGDNDQE